MKTHHRWLALIAGLIALLVWLAFFWQPDGDKDTGKAPPHAALAAAEAPAGGDFRLNGPHGPLALADLRGKVVAVYFGYTFCPDVCPTSLAALAQAFSQLAPAELEKVKGLFISVDPERDTLDILKVYVPHFHPAFLGLTGTPAEIARVARQYGARYMKQKPNSDGHYAVDHSASIYLVGPDGRLAGSLPHGATAQEIADRIRSLLKS